jgi:hypothetical protein
LLKLYLCRQPVQKINIQRSVPKELSCQLTCQLSMEAIRDAVKKGEDFCKLVKYIGFSAEYGIIFASENWNIQYENEIILISDFW